VLWRQWRHGQVAVVLPQVSVEELVTRGVYWGAFWVVMFDVHSIPCGLSRSEVQAASRLGLLASAQDGFG